METRQPRRIEPQQDARPGARTPQGGRTQNGQPQAERGTGVKPATETPRETAPKRAAGTKREAGAGREPQTRTPQQDAQPGARTPHDAARPSAGARTPQGAQPQARPRRTPPRRRPSRKSRILAKWRRRSVNGFLIIIALGFVVGLLFFARPSTSALENRELTKFPTLTWEGFLDGSFTNDLSLWFADTYPLRDPLVSLDKWLESLYGIQGDERMIGGNVAADELPVPDDDANEAEQPATREVVEPPTEEAMAQDIQNQIMNGLYVSNGAAYSIYYFSQEAVQGYAAAINACAQELDDQAKVYSVLAPNSSAVLDDATRERLGGTDMQQAIAYFNSLYDPSVGTVDSW